MRKWIYYCGSWASLIGCLLVASGLESYTGWAMAGCFVGALVLLALAVVVIGGGAGWYFKIYRPKKQRAAESEADYGGEYDGAENYDETDPEDDGPPWDEDGEE